MYFCRTASSETKKNVNRLAEHKSSINRKANQSYSLQSHEQNDKFKTKISEPKFHNESFKTKISKRKITGLKITGQKI